MQVTLAFAGACDVLYMDGLHWQVLLRTQLLLVCSARSCCAALCCWYARPVRTCITDIVSARCCCDMPWAADVMCTTQGASTAHWQTQVFRWLRTQRIDEAGCGSCDEPPRSHQKSYSMAHKFWLADCAARESAALSQWHGAWLGLLAGQLLFALCMCVWYCYVAGNGMGSASSKGLC